MAIDGKEEKIKNLKTEIEKLKNQDSGFKVLKLSESNFKQWKQIKGNALDRLFKGNDQLKTNTSLQMRDAEIEFKTI